MTSSRDPRNTPPAAEPRWRLADPGLPETSLRQRVYRQCRAVALTCVVFGPGPLEECLAEATRWVPALRGCLADEHGFGLLEGDRLTWAAVHGPLGSALLFFPGNGGLELLLRQVADRLPELRPPWKWTLEIRDGDWQKSVARVLDRSRAVPAWDLGAVLDRGPHAGAWAGGPAPAAER
ncbi:MAG: hypothetical protein ACOYBY_09655 [Dermatophilaceae bacterium]